jgi:hypothetical protein
VVVVVSVDGAVMLVAAGNVRTGATVGPGRGRRRRDRGGLSLAVELCGDGLATGSMFVIAKHREEERQDQEGPGGILGPTGKHCARTRAKERGGRGIAESHAQTGLLFGNWTRTIRIKSRLLRTRTNVSSPMMSEVIMEGEDDGQGRRIRSSS